MELFGLFENTVMLEALYYGIFNMLQLENKYVGAAIPIITYIPINFFRIRTLRKSKKTAAG